MSDEYANPDIGGQQATDQARGLDGLPDTKPITRAAASAVARKLPMFAQAVKSEHLDPHTDPHCMVISGPIGPSYGLAHDEDLDDAVIDSCQKHFGDSGKNRFGHHKANGSGAYYPDKPIAHTIHVIVHSKGGSLDSAYKSVLFLRRFAQNVVAYVPVHAKSAATLIVIGADKILISPFGELGPLDTQIRNPRNPTQYVSALDCYQSVDYVREFAIYTMKRALTFLSQEQRLVKPEQLITTATDISLGAIRPMLAEVTALDFGGWGRTLNIGETYARELLSRLHNEDSEAVARKIASKLVYGYTHHPYPIDLDEAQKIGLDAEMMPRQTYAVARDIVEACDGYSFVGFAEDAERAVASISGRELLGFRAKETVEAEPVKGMVWSREPRRK